MGLVDYSGSSSEDDDDDDMEMPDNYAGPVVEQLEEALRKHVKKVMALFRKWDTNGGQSAPHSPVALACCASSAA